MMSLPEGRRQAAGANAEVTMLTPGHQLAMFLITIVFNTINFVFACAIC